MKISAIAVSALLAVSLTASCTVDGDEYDRAESLRNEYRDQLAKLRQMNETMSKNITAAYLELETLKERLAEKEALAARQKAQTQDEKPQSGSGRRSAGSR
jgi:regulator of replication initiation timing